MAKRDDAPAPGEQPPQAGPGQVENLGDLAREAAAMEQGEQLQQQERRDLVATQERNQADAQQAQAAAELAAVLGMLRTMVAPPVEALGYLKPGQTKEIWTDDVLSAAAAPLVAIMERHGIGLGDLMASWGPYAMLFVATAVPAMATVKAVRENRSDKAAEAAKAAAATGQPAEAAP